MQNFLSTLIICSAITSVLALLYMAATPFLAKRYSEKWRYYVWLIIIVGLIIPFRPQWGGALINVEMPVSAPPPAAHVIGEMPDYFTPVTVPPSLPHVQSAAISSGPAAEISLWHIGLAVWLTGVITFIAIQGIKHYRFNKAARRWSKSITDTHILSKLENLRANMGISKTIPIYHCPIAGAPMMVGLFNPRILLPDTSPEADELDFILKHELVHYRRKDLLYKYLLVVATALHWFNPAVHLMARAVNSLCEISCDAEVLQSADVETRQYYGETIIGVVKYQAKLKTALSTSFYGGKKGMTKRVFSIMDTREKKAGLIVACLVLLLVMGTGFILTASPAQDEHAVEPYHDAENFGLTDEARTIMYEILANDRNADEYRARLYEIMRADVIASALRRMDRIFDAMVIVNSGDLNPFVVPEGVRPASATVSLNILGGPLSPQEVAAIGEIVRTSVPGLELENITITDQYLNLYRLHSDQNYELLTQLYRKHSEQNYELLTQITRVYILFVDQILHDFTDVVGTHTPLGLRIDSIYPEDAEWEITWVSSNPGIVDIIPDPGGLTATAVHLSPGMATITVTVNGVSAETIARTWELREREDFDPFEPAEWWQPPVYD